ncbi:uncharacterized protein FSUBG_13491 [Fusarium subglutinans]|uniref:Uncharacterized protein n=1 Tax=Gibberella subglutinans TaxID=42677 RepID=A0A8H5KVI8_GIBSU|nr:uncharacterized protein FSUBG_13491 [Fusarium subglutinans]KAF5580052.1 hypothetical protein FSUBG_13491 [Fusarium subglutinans]
MWLEILAIVLQPEGLQRLVIVHPGTACSTFNFRRVFQPDVEPGQFLRTYEQWLKVVRDYWSRSDHPSGVDLTTFVFEVHPVMTVPCAMALLATIQTAVETAPGNVRVLTVSSTDIDRAFVRLVEHYGFESPQLFTHINSASSETEPDDVRTIYCASKAELNRRAIERIGSLQGKQIIIDTHPCYLAKILDLDDSWKHVSMVSSDLQLIWDALDGVLDDNVVLHVLPGHYSPLPLSGYDHVHVIAESDPMTYETDTTTSQLTVSLRQWSIQERKEVREHVQRFGTKSLSVAFYVDRPKREDVNLEWWEDGPVLRRQNVWSRSLGAFIASVASLGSKVDAAAVAQCFVPEGMNTLYQTMVKRLHTQGIINLGQDGHLAMNLEGHELTAFFTVLPLVSYDHRLAYLIAQQSEPEDDVALQVKIQLAAVMTVGGLSLFNFDESLGGPEPADTLEAVIQACTGYGASLSDQGSMWLALGLWNRVGKDSMNFSQIPESDSITISGTSVRVKWSSCVTVHELWKSISSALVANGIDTVRRDLTTETQVLSHGDSRGIETHLVKAYLSQLVAHYYDGLEFLDVSSRRRINGFVSEAGLTLEFDNVLADYGPAFGIYHHLVRVDGEVVFKDWTRVSSGAVDNWMEENPDRSGEYDAIIRRRDTDETLPRPNYDEYN